MSAHRSWMTPQVTSFRTSTFEVKEDTCTWIIIISSINLNSELFPCKAPCLIKFACSPHPTTPSIETKYSLAQVANHYRQLRGRLIIKSSPRWSLSATQRTCHRTTDKMRIDGKLLPGRSIAHI
ncbi:hypothetical protein M758_UG137400 [Ceratodon purpureus]|nr:hypothetical protein M758_UG137400 [Ceratodon purpureus]